MAVLGQTFNPTEHDTEQRTEFENLPDGIYRLEVTSSDVKTGDGKTGLKLTYDVLEPEDYKDRKIFAYINLENPSVVATEIGQKEFASLCRALNISDPITDTEELHLISFTAKVGLGKATNGYAAKNEIKTFYYPTDKEGNATPPPAPAITGPVRAPANDNRRAANTNTSTTQAGGEKKQRPWGSK